MTADVIIEYNVKSLNKTFSYIVPSCFQNRLKIGHKVLIPFGNQKVEGIVININNYVDNSIDYKEIIDIIEPDFYLNDELLKLGKIISESTLSNLISCYQIMLPKALKASVKTKINRKIVEYVELINNNNEEYILNNKKNKKEIEIINLLTKEKRIKKSLISCNSLNNLITKEIVKLVREEENREVNYINEKSKNIQLTPLQQKAYDEIINTIDKPVLLRGVTGSGKTEVYIKLIEEELKQNKTAILLVPEISLTPQIIARFKSEFGDLVAVLHSRLSEGEKYDEYRKIQKQEVKIVIGARSAIFAPLENIGIIIIDECGSASYKQDNNPKYNAIEVAIERSKYHKCICVMGSATPLLEQYARGLKGIYKLVTMSSRVNNILPNIELIDMNNEIKKRNFILSERLKNKITEKLNKKEQIILLLNRRGYSTFVSCSSCGYVYKCPNCDISLIYHKTTNNLRCHYCGYSIKKNNICPKCKEEALKDLGLGTEKLENIIKNEYQDARVLRMDLDTTSKKGAYEEIIDCFKSEQYDILIGTQMISKGLNFPKVTLVGIINADASLAIPDFRSSERTFELLMQTSGRSGRNDIPGEVLIQTFNPDNYVLKCVQNHDYEKFYTEEMQIRKKLSYPPYFYIVRIKITSTDYELSKQKSLDIKRYLDNNLDDTYTILGPTTCSMFKVNNKYNFNILIKYRNIGNLFTVLKNINEQNINKNVSIDIDISPLNLI